MYESPNELIERIFAGFTVGGIEIPVKFLRYNPTPGESVDAYVVYMQTDAAEPLVGDDKLLNYIDFYDFDIYSTGNYNGIVEAIKNILESNGFMWVPSRSSGDMFDDDTELYHKTLSFSIERSTQNG